MHRRAGPGMSCQVAEGHPPGGPGVGPGAGKLDDDLADLARLLRLAARRGLGRLALAGDDELDLGDFVVVAGGIIDAQRMAFGFRRRAGEGHQRRLVVDQLIGPGGDLLAVLDHAQMVAGDDLARGAVGAFADGIEMDRGLAQLQLARTLAALDLGQDLAVLGQLQRPGLGIDGGEEDRCLAGIGGRRHPDIEARGNRRRGRGEARLHGAGQPGTAVGPADAQGHRQQQDHDAAERIGVTGSEAAPGHADAQPPQPAREAAAMQLPEGGSGRIALPARQLVLQGRQRAVGQGIDQLDAPAGIRRTRPDEAAQPQPQQAHEAEGEGGEDSDMEIAVQVRQQVAEGEGEEKSDQSQGWPDSPPKAFPGQSETGQPKPAQQSEPVQPGLLGLLPVVRSRPCLCQALLTSSRGDDPARSYHGNWGAL